MNASITVPSVFKDLIDRKIPAFIIYEDKYTLAFLDRHPLTAGHTLVIPKKEYKDIFDMPPKELAHVMASAKKVAKLLQKRLVCQGVNILHASGKAAQQSVFHFHIHVVPRTVNDGMDTWPKGDGKKVDLSVVQHKILGK